MGQFRVKIMWLSAASHLRVVVPSSHHVVIVAGGGRIWHVGNARL